MRRSIFDLTKGEAVALFRQMGEPESLTKALWSHLYKKGTPSFLHMAGIPKRVAERLHNEFDLITARLATHTGSGEDKTNKLRVMMADGVTVETVFIDTNQGQRGALCVSSQAGCSLNCSFCFTGKQKFRRNLTSGEIIQQVMLARQLIGDIPTRNDGSRTMKSMVFMGQGEPLLNYRQVIRALQIICDGEAIALGRNHVTVSTSGIVPAIEKLKLHAPVNLAVSLHAVSDELRDELVPINRTYPIAMLLEACRQYALGGSGTKCGRILIEYVMLKGVNDSLTEARELCRLLKDMPCVVNLIPFNPWPNTSYECSSASSIDEFRRVLLSHGYSCPVRNSRGQDIGAACGQLNSDHQTVPRET